jgi:hypothetical protein
MPRHGLTRLCILFLLGLLSCSKAPPAAQAGLGNDDQQLPALVRYPPGRWRLVPLVQLHDVVIWFSHIVIRHEGSRNAPALDTTGWAGSEQGSERTREEALLLATTLAAKVLASPGSFADLAKRYSDDRVTGEHGGSLGGVRASQLGEWPALLDALATMKPGDVSRVIETPLGFHVLRRSVPPELQKVAAQRIVIGHDDAPFLEFVGRGEVKHRTREEALALAQQIAEQARTQPDLFGALMDKYSEHRDAEEGGDLGLWTTHEPTWFPLERERLAKAAIGDILDPIDTRFGYAILRRTSSMERERFVASAIKLEFLWGVEPEHEYSQSNVAKRALEVVRELSAHPERFVDFQKQYRCEGVEQWTRGRVPFGLTRLISSLQIGEISKEAAVSDRNFWILKRLDPERVDPPTEPKFELPNPEHADVDYFIEHGFPQGLYDVMDEVESEAVRALPALNAKEIGLIQDAFVDTLQAQEEPEQRLYNYQQMLAKLRGLLSPSDFEKYVAIVHSVFEQNILRAAKARG